MRGKLNHLASLLYGSYLRNFSMGRSVTPEFYQQVKAAFRQTVDLPPDQRDSFLCRNFVGNDTLLAAVNALLAADGQPLTSIDRPAVSDQFHLTLQSLSYASCGR